jgi:RsiW-degrading membrane proteinase PrsW (M82 family)
MNTKVMILLALFLLIFVPQVQALNSTDDVMNYLGVIDAKLNVTDVTIGNINKNTSITTPLVSDISQEVNSNNLIYTFLFILCAILILLGYYMEDKFFPMFAGFIIVAIGIYSAQYGFYGFSNKLINDVVMLTCIGLGSYLIIKPMLELLENKQ